MKREDTQLLEEAYGNIVKHQSEKYGFFGNSNPKVGDKVIHEPTGATGIVKSLVTQGNETFVNFKSENDTKLVKKGEFVHVSAKQTRVLDQ